MSTTNSAGWDAGTSMHPAIGDEPERDHRALDGGPAFPVLEQGGDGRLELGNPGMSLRDYFAAHALQGALAYPKVSISDHRIDEYAAFAYRLADAMLKARAAS